MSGFGYERSKGITLQHNGIIIKGGMVNFGI